MFSLTFLFFLQSLAEILIQNLINTTKGIQNIPLNSYCEDLIPTKQLKIQLTQQFQGTSILAICQTNLENNDQFEQLLEQKNQESNNCLVDFNAYILRNQTQVLFIQHNHHSTLVSQYYNIFSIDKHKCHASVYSSQDSIYLLTVESYEIEECALNCKNHGICVKGFCQCPLGYFGYDCDIITTNIEQNNYFFGFQILYLDLITLQSVDYVIELNQELTYSIICYANSSHLQIPNQIGKILQINENQINSCKQQTQLLQQQTKINYYSQFIFVTNTSKIVSYSHQADEQYSSIIVFIVLASILSVIIIIIIVVYIFKIKNERKQQKQTIQMENLMPAQQFFSVSDRRSPYQDEQSCSICLEPFKPDSIVRMTYCEHIFHVTCLQNWMKKNKICPLCRAALDTVTIQSKRKTEQKPQKNHILQQLSSLQKHDGSLNSIDGNLSYQSPVTKQLAIVKHSKFAK
ncbi:unnamed protein product [Paramecium sonneborni]|uniref:RING-type domain-containing protein n=1 Tax=Paramecium sonneborni TaxID=65129 RepID=A0A8S1KQ38_9CILI|nr:unnamed protein product [Paramecium sonneborni]